MARDIVPAKQNIARRKRHAPQRPTRIVIVDDHELMRYGLRLMIGNEPEMKVCGEAADEQGAIAEVRRHHPDVVVLDLTLKKGDGIALIKRIKAVDPAVRIVVSTMHDEKIYGERTLRAGAAGYVNKQSPAGTILQAIRHVLDGKLWFSDELTQLVLRRASDAESSHPASPLEALSDRELEVFRLIGQGLATADIAERLHVSPRTVDTYRERLKRKLHIKSSVELHFQAVHSALEPTAAITTGGPSSKRKRRGKSG